MLIVTTDMHYQLCLLDPFSFYRVRGRDKGRAWERGLQTRKLAGGKFDPCTKKGGGRKCLAMQKGGGASLNLVLPKLHM